MAIVNEGFSESGGETASTTNHFAADIESLKKSFSVLRSDLMDLVDNAMGVGKSGLGAARHSAAGAAAGAVDSVKHGVAGLKDRGVQSAHALEDQVAEHPIAGTLIAFAAGFIVARMLTRK